MKQLVFQQTIIDVWSRTTMPLTRVNIIGLTGLPAAKVERHLDAMAADLLVELDSNDAGDLQWRVCGVARPTSGLATLGEVKRWNELRAETAMATRPSAPPSAFGGASGASGGGEQKSVVLSGFLSFLLGPLGLLYAAPLQVALPAGLAWLIAGALIPQFLLVYLAGVVCPVSAIAGVLYAASHNRHGARTPLLAERATKRLR